MEQPTNSALPTGGVSRPMHRLATIMMPKWTGFMPKSSAMGRNIGVKISTAGVISIKIPTINSTMLISSRITSGFSENPMSASLIM